VSVPGEPRALQDALRALGRQLGLPDPGVIARVGAMWEDVVGPVLAQHTSVRSLRDGICTVVVDGPAWATQLRYLAGDLVDRVGSALGPGVVLEVRVVVAAR
jgi:predicted nucleic acid-binding Zn ribbon protein